MQRVRDLLSSENPLRWLFYGDSITHGAFHTSGWRDYTQHFQEWLRYERGRSQDLVLNSAISGNTTRDLLATFEWRTAQFRPHVAFIMIGMNDCEESRALSPAEFGLNLHRLCENFDALDSLSVLQTTCQIQWPLGGTRMRLREYMDVVRNVAAERKLPLLDHFTHWEQQLKEKPIRSSTWMSDAIHPDAAGHRAFAEYLIDSCGGFNSASSLARVLTYRD